MDGTAENDESHSRPTRSNSSPNLLSGIKLGYFSEAFDRFKDDLDTSGFTLLDTIETYWDARIDLLERRIKEHSGRLKVKAAETLKRAGTPTATEKYSKDMEKEVQRFKEKISSRMTNLATAWESAKVVRTREKVSFFCGVMSTLATALLFGMAPDWIHIAFTVQVLYFLPLRWYTYKKKSWHYFLFDLCYYVNILCVLYIWFFPASPSLFVACYCLAHGSLASAVITWRNSLVFHDSDKVASLFIHMYPPITFTVIRHFYPDAATRFPAVAEVPVLPPIRALFVSSIIYMIWQGLYWKFLLVDKRKKIETGQRMTSFSWLLNDKRGAIGRLLSSVSPNHRELTFMTGQLVYAIVTELPAVYVLYGSPLWSQVFLLSIFSVSVWNGGGFYIEVFGRKFEKELEKLRKELAEATAASHSGGSTPIVSPKISPRTDTVSISSDEDASQPNSPRKSSHGNDDDVKGLSLDGVTREVAEQKKGQ